MENFVVSARKYRPDRFETVVGQPSITKTLINAIKAKQLAHAYLFCGPRGVGKTTCARIFAKTINCFNLGSDSEACGECESCKSFQENRSFSIHELDAASNNHVDDIRNLIDQVRIPPQVGKYSIYIIDEVHMLSQQAFNAFLKTLEEPPEHAIFILATTEKHKIIPTILSRCQIFDFNRIGVIEIMNHLRTVAERENVKFEEAALNIIAQKADGSMRDALSIFDQVVSFSGDFVDYQTVVSNLNVLDYDYYFKLTDCFLEGDYKSALMTFNEILNKGFDSHNFINGLGGHFRNLLVSRDIETIELLELSGEIAQKYIDTVKKCSVSFLFSCLDEINASDIQFKQAKDPRLHVEICLLKLSKLNMQLQDETYGSKTSQPAVNHKVAEAKKTIEQKDQAVTTDPQKTGDYQKEDQKVEDRKPEEQKKEVHKVEDPKTAVAYSQSEVPLESTPDQGDRLSQSTRPKAVKSSTPLRTTPKLSDYLKNGNINLDSGNSPEFVNLSDQEDILELNSFNLKQIWQDFAEKIKVDQPRIYHTLVNQTPDLKDQKVVLKVNNPLQKKALKTIHHELEGYLRIRTGTPGLALSTDVAEIEVDEKKLYTQEEKYNHLKSKNPNIDLFRQKLNLDFE